MSTAVFNPRVLSAFGSTGPSMLSLLNATFGVGPIVAPLVFVALGSDPRWSFGLTALATAVIWISAGAAGRGIFSPLGIAPLMAHLGERGFFWVVAGVTLGLTALAILSLRAMRR
jgi:MFS transporter, FHS family, glucose/mannose:H+ symporter